MKGVDTHARRAKMRLPEESYRGLWLRLPYNRRKHPTTNRSRRTRMNKTSRVSLGIVLSLLLATVAFAESKPSIGVAEFRNDTSAGWWSGGTGRDLAGMLTNELASPEKFKIVERAKLGPVLQE